MTTHTPLFPAIFCLVILTGLFYLIIAIALIVWKFAIAPAIVYVSNRIYQQRVIDQGLFYEQTKLIYF